MARTAGSQRARASEPAALSINLYEDVAAWSVRRIVEQLQAAPTATVTLRINSLGGDVTEGFALANALRLHRGRKVAIVEGVCASAATFPLCACDEVQMFAESLLMVHSPWGGTTGGAEDLESYAQELRRMTELMLGMYQRKTGQPPETIRAWLATETWMSPTEAKAAGFCDVILSGAPSASARARAARLTARQRSTHLRNKMIPENLRAKLAKHGLAADGGNLQEAYVAYLAATEDGPKERQEMAKAVAEQKEPPDTSDDPKDEGEDESTTGDKKARLRQDAHADPAVQKLIDSFSSKVARLCQQVDSYEAKERERTEAEFYACASEHTSREDAADYLKLCDGDHAKALKLIRKLPRRASTLGRWYGGGNPLGGSSNPAADGYPASKVVRQGTVTLHLHGHGLSQLAKRIAAERKIPLREAYKAAARERPDLARPAQ
jgi:ATP-dependent Clp endopeptidase proteolytic subunit ClpP